jgi:signal transduction histidine kinase
LLLSKAFTRVGLFALLLAVIALSLFGSLIATERALASADRESVELDAHGAALIAERELRLKTEQLAELFGPLLPATLEAAAKDTSAGPPGFDALWVLNAADRVTWRRARTAVDVDSQLLADHAREATGIGAALIRVVPRDGADTGSVLLLAVPLVHRGARLGAAIGALDAAKLLSSLQDGTIGRGALTLRSRGRTFASSSQLSPSAQRHSATATVAFPGDPLELQVTHETSGAALRTALWLLAVAALGALVTSLWRERRQALFLAGRTAELERLYQEVARSNRMKSEFLANVSHELRTPLNAVVGFVEMLREGVYGELTPRQALPVDRIAASATHLRHLVDRLLDIAKIAAGRLEVHPEPLVLRPFVLNVASEIESLVSERGLALSIGVGPTLPRIRTDQTHLRQILINLIGNAVKYTPSGGIHVRARLLGNGAAPGDDAEVNVGDPPDPTKLWVTLQVSDTGIGIAPADRERIFDEFEQVNAGARTDSARRGTGLGLAISRRLARLIGGELTVVSEVGKGSVFTVWLPVEASDAKAD